MEPLAPTESCIIDCREIRPSPMACPSIEIEVAFIGGSQTKERKREESTPNVGTHRKNGLLGFDRPRDDQTLYTSCIVNCC